MKAMEIAKKKASYWKQQAKVKWDVEGNICSKFFFNWVKERKSRNRLSALKSYRFVDLI